MFGQLRLAYFALFALAGCIFVAAAGIGQTPLIQYFTISLRGSMLPIWVLPPLLWLGWLALKLTARRNRTPTLTLWRMVRRHRTWLLRGILLTFLALPLGRAFGAIKDAIPGLMPFYADPFLIELDRFLFFGADPWQITHAVFGQAATVVVDRIYALWFFVMMAMLAWMAFTRDQKLQVKGLLAINLAWALLGNVLAIALASVGPCFVHNTYGRADFSPLMNRLHVIAEAEPLRALWAMDYLQRVQGTEAVGGGISAMPSLHVAIAFLFWLMCHEHLRSPWMKRLAAAYAIAIFVGSIHLGWHYATDGLVSIAGVWLIWRGTERFVNGVEALEVRRRIPGRPVGHPAAA